MKHVTEKAKIKRLRRNLRTWRREIIRRAWLRRDLKALPKLAGLDRSEEQRRLKNLKRNAQARLAFARSGLPLPEVVRGLFNSPNGPPRRANLLMAPKVLSFEGNYDECLGFLYEYRWRRFVHNESGSGRPRTLVLDLSKVEQMYLDAALVLVAEYHRSNISQPDFIPVIDDASWPASVTSALDMLGFYELVGAQARTADVDPAQTLSAKFLPFVSDDRVDGQRLDPIIERMKEVAGATPKRVAIYGALMEAVANAKGHAYPADMPPRVEPIAKDRWWAAGAYFPETHTLEYAVLDQGVGIAETLPRKAWWQVISRVCPPEFDDGDVIVGGIKYGRTSTGRAERGNGLWKICKLARDVPNSSVRITSGRGEVTYFGRGKPFKKVNANPFNGTLIHWTLSLPTEQPQGLLT